MAVVTLLGERPTSLAVGRAIEPLLGGTSVLVQSFVASALIVGALSWVVMPPLTGVFRRWLHAGA